MQINKQKKPADGLEIMIKVIEVLNIGTDGYIFDGIVY